MMNKTLTSVGKTLFSYAVVGVALHFLIGGWVKPLALGAIGIIAGAYIINSFRELLLNKAIFQTYRDEMEGLAKQMAAEVNCSYCSRPNAVPFRMDIRNEFDCEHCGKTNLLMVNAATAQITTPIAGVNSYAEKEGA